MDTIIKTADLPNQLAPDNITLVRNSGAGFLADLAKQAEFAGGALELTGEQCRDSGAGFVQDILKTVEVPPPPEPFSTAVVNIQNADNPAVTVDAAEFPKFPTGSTVSFAGTGNAVLDAGLPFNVISINQVGKTFKIDAQIAGAPAPIRAGTITLVSTGTGPVVYDPPLEGA